MTDPALLTKRNFFSPSRYAGRHPPKRHGASLLARERGLCTPRRCHKTRLAAGTEALSAHQLGRGGVGLGLVHLLLGPLAIIWRARAKFSMGRQLATGILIVEFIEEAENVSREG